MDYEQQEVRLPDENRKQTRPSGSAPQQRRRPASADGQQRQRSAAPSGQQRKRPAAPDGQQQKRTAAPSNQQQKRAAAPSGQQQKRTAAPSNQQQKRAAAPSGQQQRTRAAAAGTRFADEKPGNDAFVWGESAAAGTRFANEKAAEGRRPADGRRPVKRSGSAQKRPAANAAAEGTAGKKSGFSAWRIGMTIYVVLAFIGILLLSRWMWVLCREYEDSQPKYAIDSYITELNSQDAAAREAFYQNLMKEKINVLPLSQYETPESIYNTLEIEDPADYKFSWKKNGRLYKDDKPVYYLNCGEAAIAQVELVSGGTTDKHDFTLWKVGTVTSLMEVASEPEYDLNVIMPAGSTLTVNGIEVAPTAVAPADSPLKLDEAALKYAAQPDAQLCKITGLYAAPVVEAKDASGRPLTLKAEPKEGEKHISLVYSPAYEAEISDEMTQRITDLTAAYINYVINKDEAQQRNFNALAQYLVRKSTVYNAMTENMYEWGWNNPYTARKDGPTVVSNLAVYSENCCTCEVSYEYQLTKRVVNDYAGTLRWTLVKADDGKWYASSVETLKSSEGTHSTVAG